MSQGQYIGVGAATAALMVCGLVIAGAAGFVIAGAIGLALLHALAHALTQP